MLECQNLRALHERLIALYVDNDVGIGANLLGGLLNAVCTALVVGARHHGLAAKLLDRLQNALVVSRHVGFRQNAGGLFVNPLDNSLATQHGQWFTRETR